MKLNIQKNFTTVNNLYSKSFPQTIHLLLKHRKTAAPKMPASEGLSFAQGDVNKQMGREADTTREAVMIKLITRSTVRTRNATSVDKNTYIVSLHQD